MAEGNIIKVRGVEVDPPEEVVKGLEEFKPKEEILSAEEWVDKWERHAKAAKEDYKKGVRRPKRDPIKAAAAANDKYKQRLMEALEEDRWLKKMQKLNFEDWALGILLTGEGRYADGITKRRIRAEGAYKELRDLVNLLFKTIQQMPEETPEQRAAKMLAARQGMLIIGSYRKGVLTLEEARSKIEKLKGMTVTVSVPGR